MSFADFLHISSTTATKDDYILFSDLHFQNVLLRVGAKLGLQHVQYREYVRG